MFSHSRILKAVTIAAALGATVLLAPSAASAQQRPVVVYAEPSATRTELVPFAHFDLATDRDQRRLQRKVSAAVARVCLRDIARNGLQDHDYYDCEGEAWIAASPQIAAAVAKASNMAANRGAPLALAGIRISAL